MKAVVCTRYGPPEVLRGEELTTPVPRKDEVRIRILATAVTSSDCYVRGLNLSPAYRLMARLALGWNAPRQPVLGMVLSGEVDSVGPDATSLEVGDRSSASIDTASGRMRSTCAGPRTDFLRRDRPTSLTTRPRPSHTAAFSLSTSCARRAFERDSGSSCTGPRGLWARPPSNSHDTLAPRSRPSAARRTSTSSASLGATTVIDYTREDFTDRAERYDLILDAVGRRKSAAALRRCRQVLAPGGACVSVDDGRPKLLREDLVLLGELATKGEIRPVIDRTYALDDIVEAHTYVDNGHKRGNVVVSVA